MANSPLNIHVPIVDEQGRPTPSFLRWVQLVLGGGGGGGGSGTFLGLSDAPATYVGSGGYAVTVKDTEDGLEFAPITVDWISDGNDIETGYSILIIDLGD